MNAIKKNPSHNSSLASRIFALTLVTVLAFGAATTALAHQNVTIGNYTVEYGWVNEPAVAGQPNAVVINITPKDATADPNVDASGVKISAVFGGQTKVLALQPLGENTPGQFIAPITPMRPGMYTIHLGGAIGTSSFNNDVTPEEVKTADVVQFPVIDPAQGASSGSAAPGFITWLAIAGVVLGVIALVLGVIALTRKPAKG